MTKFSLLDIPDVLLVASIVVAAKYSFPFDGVERFPRDSADPLSLKMDWSLWETEFAKRPSEGRKRINFEHLDPEDIWTMSKEDIEEYLNWFHETQIDMAQAGTLPLIYALLLVENGR